MTTQILEMTSEQPLMRVLAGMRESLGLTQKDLAQKMGATQSKISKLENTSNRWVRMGQVRRYADALGYVILVRIGRGKTNDTKS